MAARRPAGAPPPLPSHHDDWVWAQAEYESGRSSITAISKEIGSTVGLVSAAAQRGAWVRDPHAKARIMEESRRILATQVALEKGSIERITAQMQSKVLVEQRTDIKAARLLCQTLLAELAAVSLNVQAFEELGDMMREPNEHGRDRLNDVYRKVLKLPERSQTLTSLVNALKTLIMLERQAFGIEGLLEDPEQARPAAEVTKGLDAIMAKFDAVLQLQAPAQAPIEVIIDVSRPNKAAATASAV